MKDIWQWLNSAVEQHGIGQELQGAYAQLFGSSEAFDEAGVRQARDQFVELSKRHNLPWLEVFGNHWYLQFQLTDLCMGEACLDEAVSAFEFAHRPENVDCPQSVCTAQDLCIAYANVDGPGYAEQRLAASRETLERIDPTWPCFDCINREMAEALEDTEQYDALIEFGPKIELLIRAEGQKPVLRWATTHMVALRRSGRLGEAVEFEASTDRNRYTTHSPKADLGYDMERAILAALSGDQDLAAQIGTEIPHPMSDLNVDAARWSEMQTHLTAVGVVDNDSSLSTSRALLVERCLGRGSYWQALLIGIDGANAAARRGALATAEVFADAASEIGAKLRKKDVTNLRLADMYHEMGTAQATAEPTDKDVELATLKTQVDQVTDQASGGQNSEDAAEIIGRYADCLAENGWAGRSEKLLD